MIAHEVGHIKAGHVLDGTMARNITALINFIGQATLGFGAIVTSGLAIALLEWYRCAELTSDRAALLCVQDLEPARDTFMKLAGGTTRLAAEMDRDEFLRQVREYEEVDRSTLDKAYKVLLTLLRTHPFAMQRAKELEVWFNSGYKRGDGPSSRARPRSVLPRAASAGSRLRAYVFTCRCLICRHR